MTRSTALATDVQAVNRNPFDLLETVSLAELNALAALQTRVDRKYLVATPELVGLFSGLGSTARVLEIDCRQHSSYTSTYYDTPAFDSYLGAARARPNRFKVRVRTYLDSDAHYLEVKTRSRTRHTTKTRCSAEANDHAELLCSSQEFVVDTLADRLPTRPRAEYAATVAALRPTLNTRYQRSTLLIEPAVDERGTAPVSSRATIDTSLAFTRPGQASLSYPGLAIIETKTAGPPSPVDRLLWRSGHRPVKVSKFGIGLALFQPDLPAAKWNRVLRRHFAWEPNR